jgi:hypothetical protein
MYLRNIKVIYSQGLRTAEWGVFSDLSGGHECEEYLRLYSQETEDCGEGVFSLTCLEVMNI